MAYDQNHNGKVGTIRVLVADNSRFHTQLLAESLQRDPGLQVITSDLDASSLVAISVSQKIDVFVLSAFAEKDAQRGFQILQELREINPQTRAVMLLDSSNTESTLEAFRAGAKGVFDHQESPDTLCQCIRCVHRGQVWLNNEQIAMVVEALASTPKVRAVDGNGMNLLSNREVQVVRSLAEGLTNREIAERMGLSQHTVKNYLFRIFDKLGVSSRMELLFMTLSQSTAAPPPLQGMLADPTDGCDQATFALCEKAAEHGIVAAQLALASMFWKGRSTDRDLISAHVWYSVALEQLTRTKNSVKRAMSPAQLAEAERQVTARLTKSRRIEPALTANSPLAYEEGISA